MLVLKAQRSKTKLWVIWVCFVIKTKIALLLGCRGRKLKSLFILGSLKSSSQRRKAAAPTTADTAVMVTKRFLKIK